MKALDDQVSDRYFEELPDRTVARLEEMMQSDVDRQRSVPAAAGASTPLPSIAKPAPAPAPAPAREEDSGLHDIRALAQTTKQRMSRRPTTQNPPIDDTVLHTSSASLRAVALPEPGKMVALAEPVVVGNGTGPAPVLDADRASSKKIGHTAAATAAPALSTASAPITPMRPRSKAPMIVTSTVLVAAAAGLIGYMVLKKDAAAPESAAPAVTASEHMTATPISAPGAAPEAAAAPVAAKAALEVEAGNADAIGAAGSGAAASGAALITTDEASKSDGDDGKDKGHHDRADHERGSGTGHKKVDEPKKPDTVKTPPADPVKKEGPADKQEQSLDDLLRGAGVDPDASKKQVAPKLDKKGLDAGDIRKAMSALDGKAQGCYGKFNVSGSVAVKLTVAASGQVKKAVVTGKFAGTPTGDCVAAIAGGAKFPPWDGATMTVNYSYFLTE